MTLITEAGGGGSRRRKKTSSHLLSLITYYLFLREATYSTFSTVSRLFGNSVAFNLFN